MNKRVILFDMDGVLIDSEPQHFREWQIVFREMFQTEIDFERYKACIGSTFETFARVMSEEYGIDIRGKDAVWARHAEVRREVEGREGYPAMPGIASVLEDLKNAGYRMAVASSSPQDYIENVARTIGIDGYFDVIFSGENVKKPKPAPDTFLEAAKRMGASPDECIVVEDSANGVRAAKAGGMFCIGLKNPHSGEQDISPADVIITNILELRDIITR